MKNYHIPIKTRCPVCNSHRWEQREVVKTGLLLYCKACSTASVITCDVSQLNVRYKKRPPVDIDIEATPPPKSKKKYNRSKKPIKEAMAAKIEQALKNRETTDSKPFVFPPECTDKQKRFCNEYMIDCNATQAAIRASYSEKTAAVRGYELMGKPHIRTAINELLARDAQRCLVTKTEITRWLLEIAGVSPADFQTMSADGVWTDDIGPDHPLKGALQSIEARTEYDANGNTSTVVKKIKTYARDGAIKQLRELLGLDAPRRHDLTSGGDPMGLIVLPAEEAPERGE